jgi:hypothetical protein
MPEATLNAVAGHGQIPGDGIRRSYDQSQAVLDELAALGIGCNDVVQVLEDQGVAAFDASWDHLGQRLASALISGAPDITATRAWGRRPRSMASTACRSSPGARPPQLSAPRPRPGGALCGCWRRFPGAEFRNADAWLGEWLQPVRGDWCPELLEDALHETEVQGAHDVLVALGHLTERALVQAELAAAPLGNGLRGEPDLRQGRSQLLDRLPGVKPLVRRRLLG